MPKRVLLLQLDGKLPNLALMRIASHHRERQDDVELRVTGNTNAVQPQLGDPAFDEVYASLIFERTKPVAEEVLTVYPHAKIGGTGWSKSDTLATVGIDPLGEVDYADYPNWKSSLGFTQRGCRLRCSFCVVPEKEGAIQEVNTIEDIWRGEPWPRHILLLDNDFFGQPHWRDRIQEIRDGKFKVSFNQGINARMLTDDTAEAIASVDYRDDSMKVRRIYTAWDNKKDETRLFRGLEALVRHGVKPRHIMVYMLCGYWPDETQDDREHRRQKLRAFGCLPYPMPYVRTQEIVGFQRWIIGAYDKTISWNEWANANYDPRRLNHGTTQEELFRNGPKTG
jgi:hypothetical protein